MEASNGFPPDIFTKEERSNGAIVFQIIGFLYMVYAITLVCDKFFVPSIDKMGKKVAIDLSWLKCQYQLSITP